MHKISLPGSKSITNRVLLIGALTKKKTILHNVLLSDDTKHMMNALKKCGIKIERKGTTITVSGTFKPKKSGLTFYCGNSGTTIRFLTALLATQRGEFTLEGNTRMRERPIKDLVDALRELGATIEYVGREGFPPLRILEPMNGGNCTVQGTVSSQYLSALLLAAPMLQESVTIEVRGNLVSKSYCAMTCEIMKKFGVTVDAPSTKKFHITAQQKYCTSGKFTIEPDASSASYFCGVSSRARGRIFIEGITEQSLQPDARSKHIIESIVTGKSPNEINCEDFPDSAMTIACICAMIKGAWKLRGLQTLRVKECDRLTALSTELKKIGAQVTATDDSLIITGGTLKNRAVKIATYDDHRMAMCFGMLKVFLPKIKIENPSCVSKTFPAYWSYLRRIQKALANRNVVLIGMRGAGKSQIGKGMAKLLKRRLIDIDSLIEKEVNMPIATYVAKYGWEAFRKKEFQVVKKISKLKKLVISCGGGTILFEKNAALLKENGVVMYLSCALTELKRRLALTSHRPSLTAGKSVVDELEAVLAVRDPIYQEQSDIAFDVSEKTASMSQDIARKSKNATALVRELGIK